MTYLGLDLGTKTLGISKSNGVIATFYKTIRHDEDYDYLISELKNIIEKEKVDVVVLGYPKNMNNTLSDMTNIVLEFKKKLEELGINVVLEDERLLFGTKDKNIFIFNKIIFKPELVIGSQIGQILYIVKLNSNILANCSIVM